MTVRTGFEIFDAEIAEMRSAADVDKDSLVSVSPELLAAVSEGDPDPLFVTMNIATEGVSKNGRHYSRETIQSMADQINAEVTDGYNGHLTDAERATKRPDTVTMWLGARVVVKPDGKAYLYAKGYIMPEEKKLRSYLKRAKAVGKNVAVSVFGKAEKAVYNAQKQAYDLTNFVLQSIDWARSKSEGIPNDGTLILASEMVNEEKEEAMKRAEVIESLTPEELRTHNPGLVSEMEQAAVEAEKATHVAEMEASTVAVAEMRRENHELKLDQQLAEKVRVQGARPVLREMVIGEMDKAEDQSLVDVAEMVDSVLGSDEGRAIIDSHRAKAPAVNPLNSSRGESVPERKFSNIKPRTKK